jgi:pre-mRNA-splicing regulator WTAP
MQNLISTTKIRQTFVDPSVNIVLNQLKKELDENRKVYFYSNFFSKQKNIFSFKQKEDALNELNAYKFTSESQMGKRLMAKCRKLIQENEELGKMISSGNIANLECDVTYHKRLLNEAYETEKSKLNFCFKINLLIKNQFQGLHLFLNEMDTEMVRNK